MIFGEFPQRHERYLEQFLIVSENQHTQGRKISENHAKNENFIPKNISANIELGDTQDNIFS